MKTSTSPDTKSVLMSELTWHDLQFAMLRIPKILLKIMRDDKCWEGRIFVGGGFVRSVIAGDSVNDIDVFVNSKDDAKALAVELVCQRIYKKGHNECSEEEFKKAVSRIYETDNALTLCCFHPTIQIIHRWTFDSARAAACSFDFTCCAAMIWRENDRWHSCCHERFYADVAARRLVYLNPIRNEDAGGSMLRVLKYYQKGYRIPLDSLADVVTRLVQGVDFTKTTLVLIDGKKTVSADWFSKIICGLLREVDPSVDPSHVAHLPAENSNEPLSQAEDDSED